MSRINRSQTPGTSPALAQAGGLIAAGKLEDAAKLLLLQSKSGDPAVLHMLGMTQLMLNQTDAAAFALQRAASVAPSGPAGEPIICDYAGLLAGKKQYAEALKIIDRALTGRPAPGLASTVRVQLLVRLGREADALAHAEAAAKADPSHPEAQHALAIVFERLGRADEAVIAYNRAGKQSHAARLQRERTNIRASVQELAELVRLLPDAEAAWTNYASALNYDPHATREEQTRAHKEFARAVRLRVGPSSTSWNVSREPDRPLRVAIVSPDLREHAIVSFFAPLLEHYDCSQWEVIAFATSTEQDHVTKHLRTIVKAWRECPARNAAYLARRIRDDRIDVCIELSGHTAGHRLDALHLRPAPVQATYLGYPNTTGLDTIDIRLIDSITDPPGSEPWATERLARIDPCFLCYKPIVDSPDLPAPPCATPGNPIRFGSFNIPTKISTITRDLWSRTLAAVPGSTLVLKHVLLQEPWRREEIRATLAASGIDPSRIEVLPPALTYREHLDAYRHVDIGLDTFPYHGTTTTCEAMWMGVPIITLEGDRHAARVGCSLLSAVGLPDLIARSPEQYAQIAATLAADRARIITLRSANPNGLRETMRRSPLCDAPAFAARFQSAIRDAWRHWCASGT
ncbi:MAG: hypothetical protein K2W85_00485 [Phycisphaerales bacterium]|nr:hypothetical protein [Phycisphaerales bacterium]